MSSQAVMNDRYDHAPNDSPRSGSTKKVTPVVWGAIVLVIVLLSIWFTMKGVGSEGTGELPKYPDVLSRNHSLQVALPYR
jgi:hypothetical protein